MKRRLLTACSALVSSVLLFQPAFAQAPSAAPPALTVQPNPAGATARMFRDPAADPKLSTGELVALLRQHVKYVFVLFQENRSFDSYFGTFPGANGLFSDGTQPRPTAQVAGFTQDLIDVDGKTVQVSPFRLGPDQHAADLDDVDHSHVRMANKMHLVGGVPKMDRFAIEEERKYMPAGANLPPLKAKQMGELDMAYVDCDTIPFMWAYASRFTLFDNIFQTTIGPSTPNAIAMLAGQVGETQWVKHPDQASANGSTTVPVMNDPIPLWGSKADRTAGRQQPANPQRESSGPNNSNSAPNLTFASVPLTLAGRTLAATAAKDTDAARDLADVQQDIPAITQRNGSPYPWAWYEEGYDREPNEPASAPADGSHLSYIGHHNGAQYFGYLVNNPDMAARLHGLGDFYADMGAGRLPSEGGVFYVRGGYTDIGGIKPAWDDKSPESAVVQRLFQGDDDHPGYSDSEISEAMVARSVNAIARSQYWAQSVTIITYDESEGSYDHVPPRILSYDPDHVPLSRGPRIPLLMIGPYARAHVVAHEEGDHNSVIAMIDTLFDLPPLAGLPDELQARIGGRAPRFNGPDGFVQENLGPHDAMTPGTSNLLSGFDPAALHGDVAPLPPEYAEVPDDVIRTLPHFGGRGCAALGITPTDREQNIANPIPADFNPRPLSFPTPIPAASPVPAAVVPGVSRPGAPTESTPTQSNVAPQPAPK